MLVNRKLKVAKSSSTNIETKNFQEAGGFQFSLDITSPRVCSPRIKEKGD